MFQECLSKDPAVIFAFFAENLESFDVSAQDSAIQAHFPHVLDENQIQLFFAVSSKSIIKV